jgi:tetratricopeptide (TPR) repeat protein
VWDYKIVEQFPVDGTACRLLVTTRSSALAVKIDGADIRLDLLTPEEGAALIARHAGGSESDPVYIQIARTLGGHTLAIAIAGRQIANQYADNAADLLRMLTTGSNPFAHLVLSHDDKNENLELSLSLSYNGLSDDLKRRFRFTGVIALESTFDRAMLAALWGDSDSDDARAPINTLVDAGLLERADDGRLYQHRLLRAYSHALLVKTDEFDAAFGAYADYVIAQCAQFDALPPEEWAVLDPLLPHVREVGDTLVTLYTASNEPNETLVQRAGDFAYAVTQYVARRPQIADTPMEPKRLGLDWLEMGLNVSRQTQNPKREAFFGNVVGLAWSDLGEQRTALEYYQQALDLGRAVGDRGGEASTLNNIGTAWSDLGEHDKALKYYEQALESVRAVGDRGGEATTLNNIGTLWDALGEKRKALEYYEQALPLKRAVGDRPGEAATLNNIGLVWSALGEQRKALEYYDQALELARAGGDRDLEATTLNNIGGAWDALGEKRKALEYYEQALPLSRAVGNRGGEAAALSNIGFAWDALGEKRKALDYFQQALPVFRAVRDRGGEATTLNNIGLAWSALGEQRKALEYYDQALPVFHVLENRRGEAVTCFNIAKVHRDLGDLNEAVRFLERCVQLDEEIDHPNLERDRQILERVRRERDGGG